MVHLRIADKLGVDVKVILLLNKEKYKGLVQGAKLMEGTVLTLPYDGVSGEVFGPAATSSRREREADRSGKRRYDSKGRDQRTDDCTRKERIGEVASQHTAPESKRRKVNAPIEKLEELLRRLKKLDARRIFHYPVTDDEAPNYSKVLRFLTNDSTVSFLVC